MRKAAPKKSAKRAAAKPALRKGARTTARKGARTTPRKGARTKVRKSARTTARKSARTTSRKGARVTTRKSARKTALPTPSTAPITTERTTPLHAAETASPAKVSPAQAPRRTARKPATKMPGHISGPLGVTTHAMGAAKAKAAGADLPAYAGVGNAAVTKATGRGWAEWLEILDAAGGRDTDHKGIVAYIASRGDVEPWWQQTITVGYEQARGLREVHQQSDGFSMNRSKTIAVPVSQLFEAWNDERARARWLAADVVVRQATPDKSMRITLDDGTTDVEVSFSSKGTSKSQVTVEHNKLASAQDVARLKEFWGKALDRLGAELESAW
jgi:hypothetical protein